MVSTRNNSITHVSTMKSVQESINELKVVIVEIKEGMKTFLVGQKVLSDEVNKLKNGESTSHNGQDSTNHHSGSPYQGGGGVGNTYKKGNDGYGRLAKIEFPKFSGDDVKALIWHQQFCKRFSEDYPWELYAKEAIWRFDSIFYDPLMELKNLKQDGTVKEYHEKMFTLDTLNDVYYLAKMQEQTIVAMKSRYGPILPTPKPISNVSNKPVTSYQRTSSSNVYFPGHKCSGQLHSLEVVIERTEDAGEEIFEECTNETLRIRGYVGKQVVYILIDCGSTHNFMDIQTAKRIGCKMQSICPLKVDVADGGCEMVLGVQWLATLGDIKFNFQKLTMEFDYEKSKVLLRESEQGIVKHPCKAVEDLLTEYADVYSMPNALPPKRSHDHHIPLLPNTSLINIRPYRHPPNQKDAIKLMVKELLDSRVIRPSQSPFSSSIVMVKKKDGSWRMCIDYRQLNKHIIKYKFPIPMIEELIDELQVICTDIAKIAKNSQNRAKTNMR
ncbi:hypothetical protein Tco_0924365 [Tanacetum coccineum]|uniref:Retrotransposon gag domain-containing protein n=1 Tax=Tanacetum coccineum TaxID=301880 RepID=A0ABQ5D6S9_9ASTR